MIRMAFLLLFSTPLLFACKSGRTLFGAKRPHEQYAQKLKDAGLEQTALGRQWFHAAETSLNAPQTITLPYKEVGYFAADRPRASGLKFSAKRGEKLLFQFEKTPITGFYVYVELWRVGSDNQSSFIKATDTLQQTFEQEVDDNETYILRIQPELLKSGNYTLAISVGSTLAYPVPGGRVGSVWGDARDAGTRRHEGIDIFAAKRTPTVAAADGVITSVREGGIGGKAIFMRPYGKPYSLYYAHLDEQLVTNGQRVKAGDTIGLVGNTGNAATTSPHLHFGIYAMGGAIDPLPFVNPTVRKPTDIASNMTNLTLMLRSTTTIKTQEKSYNTNSIVFPLAITAKTYRVELPDGTKTEVSAAALQRVETAIKQSKTKGDSFLLESPFESSPKKLSLKEATPVRVLGYFGDYSFIETESNKGWLPSVVL